MWYQVSPCPFSLSLRSEANRWCRSARSCPSSARCGKHVAGRRHVGAHYASAREANSFEVPRCYRGALASSKRHVGTTDVGVVGKAGARSTAQCRDGWSLPTRHGVRGSLFTVYIACCAHFSVVSHMLTSALASLLECWAATCGAPSTHDEDRALLRLCGGHGMADAHVGGPAASLYRTGHIQC